MEANPLIRLENEVLQKAGLQNISAADCRWLAVEIQKQTGHHVSETTLKRFFGFAASNYHLSGFTKNVLSNYLGFSDWSKFLLQERESEDDKQDEWGLLQRKAQRISRYTFQALKNRSGIPFEFTVGRDFAEDHLRYFLDSDYLASSFVAPGGYGKSILLTRLVEKFWLGENPVYKDDIIWFVSGQTLGGLLNMGFDLDEWFMNQVGLIEQENFREYFGKNKRKLKGRLIMILDGFDEMIPKDDQIQSFFTKIFDFITVNQESKWFKLLLSVRSYTWEHVVDAINNSNFFKYR